MHEQSIGKVPYIFFSIKNVIWHPSTNDTQSKKCKRIGPLQLYLVLKKKKQEYTTDVCSRKETRRISIGQQKKP
jgi:hypothetical protein